MNYASLEDLCDGEDDFAIDPNPCMKDELPTDPNMISPEQEYDERGDCAGNIGEFDRDNPGFRRCDCEDFPCCGH